MAELLPAPLRGHSSSALLQAGRLFEQWPPALFKALRCAHPRAARGAGPQPRSCPPAQQRDATLMHDFSMGPQSKGRTMGSMKASVQIRRATPSNNCFMPGLVSVRAAWPLMPFPTPTLHSRGAILLLLGGRVSCCGWTSTAVAIGRVFLLCQRWGAPMFCSDAAHALRCPPHQLDAVNPCPAQHCSPAACHAWVRSTSPAPLSPALFPCRGGKGAGDFPLNTSLGRPCGPHHTHSTHNST